MIWTEDTKKHIHYLLSHFIWTEDIGETHPLHSITLMIWTEDPEKHIH